jgi:adenosylcobinamide-GDP ribazoletransferase
MVFSWIIRPLLAALSFLTIAPVGRARIDEEHLGRSVGFFPLVGLGLGGALWGLDWLLGSRLPPLLTGLLLAAALALLTRGLHLDGLADVFDGLGGARGDRERALAIMKDGRIGAFGAIALVTVLLAKALSLGAVSDGRYLLLFPAVSRFCAVPLVVLFPYARAEGLGSAFTRHAGALQLLLAALFIGAAVAWWWCSGLSLPVLAALLVALGFAALVHRRLGGLTGDVYGGAIELAEVCFLLFVIIAR